MNYLFFLQRLLIAVPTLALASMFIFGLSRCNNEDLVAKVHGGENTTRGEHTLTLANRYHERAIELNTDGPLFYFSMHPAAFPDTLHRIYPPKRRGHLSNLCQQTGNWPAVQTFDHALLTLETAIQSVPDSLSIRINLKQALDSIRAIEHIPYLDTALVYAHRYETSFPAVQHAIRQLETSVAALHVTHKPLILVPDFQWNGLNNQYHHWVANFLRGNWGKSFYSKQSVWSELKFPVLYSLIINIFTIVLSFIFALPIGMAMAQYKDRPFDQWTKRLMLFLYIVPSFIIGALLILLFATPGIGLYWIDGIKIEPFEISRLSFFAWFFQTLPQFVLPVVTMILPTVAYLAFMMRGSVLETITQNYIRTARAKGVGENDVYEKHAYRNALFPIITLFAGVFPGVFVGSLAVEYLFNYPGMGMKMQSAFINQDHPILFTILMIAAMLTILGNIISDMLYMYIDPRAEL